MNQTREHLVTILTDLLSGSPGQSRRGQGVCFSRSDFRRTALLTIYIELLAPQDNRFYAPME